MTERIEIIDDEAVAAAWVADEDGRDDAPRKDRVNHASKIGHPCDRYLVLRRTHGDKASPPSPRLKAIFKRGRVLERSVATKQFTRAGWRVWDEQRTFDLKEKGQTILSCRIDCLAKQPEGEQTYVVDHKIINPYDWEKIPRGWDGYGWLRDSPKPWLQAWPAQVMTYMYVHPGSAETGILHLVNAETLLPKFVYIPFDVDYMQWIIDRAWRIHETAAKVEKDGMLALPPPIEWDESVCGRCELLGTCMPDQLGRTALELIEDESFVDLVRRDRELNASKKIIDSEYEKVHAQVKHMVGERPEIVAGPYWITQKTVNVKERIAKAYSYALMTIKDTTPKAEAEEVGDGAA